ncbi:MAG: polysaccharide biosynthesis/export family protein [Chloracidobacterium sp.]|nr:polysaccharide biosynthesis/export family protein [Chloracidobacterium sp.]
MRIFVTKPVATLSSKVFLAVSLILATASISVSAQESTSQNPNYRIGPGDIIDVNVSQSSQLTRTGVRVNNQGMIQLPMLDEDIQAGCRTERELAEQIREKYKKFLLNPYITVAVQQFNSNPVAVIGAVNTPGRFQLQRPVRLLELLTWVNGTAERAGSSIEILRSRSLPFCDGPQLVLTEGVGDELISLSLADTFKGTEGSNPYVRAGDIIRIADAEITKAYIVGNVKNATAISLKDPVTLSQAIAMAGGLAAGAQSEKIIIRRRLNGSINPTEIAANLKEINLRKKDDILLQTNDIVEVPGPKKTFLGELGKILIPTLTTLPLRVIP